MQIHFGALAEPITKQLKAQKLKFEAGDIKFFQKIADSITLLGIHDVLSDKEKTSARDRLYKLIGKYLKRRNKPKK